MKKVLIVAGLAAVAAGGWLAFRGGETPETADASEVKPKVRRIGSAGEKSAAREKIEAAAAAIASRPSRRGPRVRIATGEDAEALWIFEDGTPWPEAQKVLMRAITAAADEDDFAGVAALAAEVAACDNAELREKFVDELGWFGEKAFVELANFISDPNEEVAEAARTQITDAFQEIDSDAEKAALFSLMAKAVSDDDLLETFADELTTMDEVLALQTIVDAISDGTPKAQKAVKEAYEQITDKKWKDIDSAEAWLADNYDSDDDDDNDASDAETVATTAKTTKSKKAKEEKKSTSRSTSHSRRRDITVSDVEVAEGEGEIEEGEAEVTEEGEGEIGEEGEGEETDEEEGFEDEDEAEDIPDDDGEAEADEN